MTLTPLVLTDCRIYYHTADLTGWSNKVDTQISVEDLDATTFGDVDPTTGQTWHVRVGGLFDTSVGLTCFWQAGDLSMPDDAFWASLGATQPLTVVPTSGAAGSLAYLTQSLNCSYKPGADTGKLLTADVALNGNWPMVRGAILHPQGTARTSTGTGTAQQLGALDVNSALYATLHVLSVAGTTPSLIVKIQSDDNAGFTSPTDQATFTAATALGGQAVKVTGPVTDTYWRASWTITGTTPSFLFAVAAGIARK